MQVRSLDIWKQAISFHRTYWKDLLTILPLLFFPFIGDLLQSVLIEQKTNRQEIFLQQAVRKAWSLFPEFFFMKIYFEGIAILWSLIPIYGTIQSFRYRLYWGMTSNVLVFEGLYGKVGRQRCRELIDNTARRIVTRTLVVVPTLFSCGLFLIWVVGGAIYGNLYSYGFWIFIVFTLWIILMGSGAANTFLYLELTGRDNKVNQPSFAQQIDSSTQSLR